MELRQLEYAVAVAEELHFGRAAERLRVAQPSLSRQIRDLEHNLGLRIFERTSRNVELTPAGQFFIEAAQRTLRMADAARGTAAAASRGWIGRVCLGFVTTAAEEMLPPLIAKERTRPTNLELDLRELNTAQQVDGLLSGDIDLGITRDLPAVPGLVLTPLFREPLIAAVSDRHRLRNRRAAALDDFAGDEFVALPRASAPRMWKLLSALELRTGTTCTIAQEARQFTTVLALVMADLGVAFVPRSVRRLRREGVHYLRLRDPEAYSEVQVVRRADESRRGVLDLHQLATDTLADTAVGDDEVR